MLTQQNKIFVVLALSTAILLSILLLACSGIPVHRPCKVPRGLIEQDLIGVWQISYTRQPYVVSNPIEGSLVITGTTPYLVALDATPMPLEKCQPLVNFGQIDESAAWQWCSQLRGKDYLMEGEETIVLHEDGTFQQGFSSDVYSYTSPLYQWEWIADTPDGPKLKMHNMKYFAEGAKQADSDIQVILKPQTVDLLRIQEYVESTEPRPEGLGGGVLYPDDGYIYLYPRICEGGMSLVQMGWRVGDPDNLVTSNPVFQRSR